jgi:hypothetical protein
VDNLWDIDYALASIATEANLEAVLGLARPARLERATCGFEDEKISLTY